MVSTIQVPKKELFLSLKLSQPNQMVCKGNIATCHSLNEDKCTQEMCDRHSQISLILC